VHLETSEFLCFRLRRQSSRRWFWLTRALPMLQWSEFLTPVPENFPKRTWSWSRERRSPNMKWNSL